jgi:16S rRNA (guanine527-N7)-methyltransferase
MEPDAQAILDRFDVSRETGQRLNDYVNLLLSWQKRINLIGPATTPHIWERHILDSLQLLPLLPKKTVTIAELGSGAGIPGLVISIAAGLSAHLYESNGKKAAFLREAARQLRVQAHVHMIRLETLRTARDVPTVQCVLARALAPLPLLLDYAEPFLSRGAIGLFHKGQDVDAELIEAAKSWKIEYRKHPSQCDRRGVILEIQEASRV